MDVLENRAGLIEPEYLPLSSVISRLEGISNRQAWAHIVDLLGNNCPVTVLRHRKRTFFKAKQTEVLVEYLQERVNLGQSPV